MLLSATGRPPLEIWREIFSNVIITNRSLSPNFDSLDQVAIANIPTMTWCVYTAECQCDLQLLTMRTLVRYSVSLPQFATCLLFFADSYASFLLVLDPFHGREHTTTACKCVVSATRMASTQHLPSCPCSSEPDRMLVFQYRAALVTEHHIACLKFITTQHPW